MATELEGLRSILEVRLLGIARVVRQAKPADGERLDHPDVRALLNTTGKGRSDGRRGRRGRGGTDEGTGVGSSPDTRQCGGSRSDRHAALGLFWSTAGCVRREGRPSCRSGMGRPDEVAEGRLVPDDQRICYRDRLDDRRWRRASLNRDGESERIHFHRRIRRRSAAKPQEANASLATLISSSSDTPVRSTSRASVRRMLF